MDFEDRVGKDVGDPHIDLRKTATVESLALQLDDDEVPSGQGRARDVEQGELGLRVLALGAERSAGVGVVGLAEQLDDDRDTLDLAAPAEARFDLTEAGALQVRRQRPVRVGRLRLDGEPDDEVDVCCPDVGRGPLGQLAREVPGDETAGQVDTLPPEADIAEDRDERPLAPAVVSSSYSV